MARYGLASRSAGTKNLKSKGSAEPTATCRTCVSSTMSPRVKRKRACPSWPPLFSTPKVTVTVWLTGSSVSAGREMTRRAGPWTVKVTAV